MGNLFEIFSGRFKILVIYNHYSVVLNLCVSVQTVCFPFARAGCGFGFGLPLPFGFGLGIARAFFFEPPLISEDEMNT